MTGSVPPLSQPSTAPTTPEGAPQPFRIDLTTGGLVRGLIGLVWPIMLASLLQMLVGFVDVLMVGRLPNATTALAAVNMSWKITFVAMVIVMAISTGAQVLVSRSVGAGDMVTAERATGQAFWLLGLSVGLVLTPLGTLFAPQLLYLTGATPDLQAIGTPYLRLIFLAGPAMLTSFIFSACLQGAGDSRSPLLLTAFINVLNVFFNYTLVFGRLGFPAMGVLGSALGTFTARWISAAIVMLLLSSGKLAISVRWQDHLKPDVAIWWRMLRIGIPSGLQGLVRAVSGWLMLRLLALSPEAEAVIGGNGIAEQVLMLTGFIGFAAMPAGMTVVGQNLGAGQPQRAEAGAWSVVKLAAGLMCVPALIYFTGAPLWVRLVGPKATEPALLYATLALRVLAWGEPSWAVNMGLGGALRGGGDTLSPLIFTAVTQLGMGIGGGALVVLFTPAGPLGLWTAIVVAMYVQSLITVWWFKQGRWKTLAV